MKLPNFEEYKHLKKINESLEKDKLTLSEMTITNLIQNTSEKDSGVFAKSNKKEIQESFTRYNKILGNVYKEDVNVYTLFGSYLRYVYTTVSKIYDNTTIPTLLKSQDKNATYNIDFLRFNVDKGNNIKKESLETVKKYLQAFKKTSLTLESIISEQNVKNFITKYGVNYKINIPNILKRGNIDDVFDFIAFPKYDKVNDDTLPQFTDILKKSERVEEILNSLFAEYGGLQEFYKNFFKDMSDAMEYKIYSSEDSEFSTKFGNQFFVNFNNYNKKKFQTLQNIKPVDIENKQTKNMLNNILTVMYFLKYVEGYLYYYTKKQFPEFELNVSIDKTNLKPTDPVVKSAEKYAETTPTKDVKPQDVNVSKTSTGFASTTVSKGIQKFQGIFGGSTGSKDLKESRESSQEVANMQATLALCVVALVSPSTIDKFVANQKDSRFSEEIGKIKLISKDDLDENKMLKIKSKLNDGIFGFRTKKLLLLFKEEYNQNYIFKNFDKISKPESPVFDDETRKALDIAKQIVADLIDVKTIKPSELSKNQVDLKDSREKVGKEKTEVNLKSLRDTLGIEQGETIGSVADKVDDFNKEAKTGGSEPADK